MIVGGGVNGRHGSGNHAGGFTRLQQRFDHVRQPSGRAAGRRDKMLHRRIIRGMVNAVNKHAAVSGQFMGVVGDLKRRTDNHLLRTALKVSAGAAARVSGRRGRIDIVPGALHNEPHLFAGPIYLARVAKPGQDLDPAPVYFKGAAGPVDNFHLTFLPGVAVKKTIQAAEGRILHQVIDHVLQSSPHGAARIDHKSIKMTHIQVMPQGQLADSAGPVNTQYIPISQVLIQNDSSLDSIERQTAAPQPG